MKGCFECCPRWRLLIIGVERRCQRKGEGGSLMMNEQSLAKHVLSVQPKVARAHSRTSWRAGNFLIKDDILSGDRWRNKLFKNM